MCVETMRNNHWMQLIHQWDILTINMHACSVASVVSDSATLRTRSPPGFYVHRDSSGKKLEWAASPPPGDVLNPGIKPMSPVSCICRCNSLSLAPPGKPDYKIHIYNNKMRNSLSKN